MLQNFALFLTIFAQVEPQNQTPIWLPILIIIILLLFLWWGLTRNSIPEGDTAAHSLSSHDGHGDDSHDQDSHVAPTAAVERSHESADHAAEAAALHTAPAHDATVEDDAEVTADSVPMAHTAAVKVDVPPPPSETIPTHTEPVPDSEDASIEIDAPPPEDAGVHPTAEDAIGGTTPAVPDAPGEPDDLTTIEGIGPKINSVLNAAGITTFEQVANTSVDDLNRIVKTEGGVRIAFPESWPEQAELAAKGEWEALEKMQDQLQAGRKT